MSPQPKKPSFEIVMRKNGVLEVIDPRYTPPTSEERAARKSRNARYGHIKRKLNNNEPLTGELLELALEITVGTRDNKHNLDIENKLKQGKPLSNYEHHIMVDVLLLHARLGSGQKIFKI